MTSLSSGTILSCGPFARVGSNTDPEAPSSIRAPLVTNGDWKGTPEGQEALRKTEEKIARAVEAGTLPPTTAVEFIAPDVAVVKASFPNWASTVAASATFKKDVLAVTGAAMENGLVIPKLT
jgi:hypothetical protein